MAAVQVQAAFLVLFCSCCLLIRGVPVRQVEDLSWWQKAGIYQIYPRSFKDSDNDGVGDLRGVTDKLTYFVDTGLSALWLSPVYPSPMVDFGYDISDFKDIDPIFGSLDDFDELVREAHALGLKIIMDFVPNHSSDQHEWFKKSVNRESGFEDYYVWRDSKGTDADGNPIPPNNWLSVFRGSAWEYHPTRKQFYLHKFVKEQPDLNYRNSKVVQEMKDVLVFWMKRGVDGFRVDAISQLFESLGLEDEPVAFPPISDHEDPDYLEHIYTEYQPETYDMVQQWRALVDDFSESDGVERCIMVEAYGDSSVVMPFYGTDDKPGVHFPFNFLLIDTDNTTTSRDFKRIIDEWYDNVPEGRWSDWVIGNHDRHRAGSRVGADLIDGMHLLLTMLPGTSVTYYGEEIGMVDNTDITYEEGVDPWGCNYPPEQFLQRSRDFERTPFQWDNTTNAGFNTGAPTWLPVHKNYPTVNVVTESNDLYSHYSIYKDLIRARGNSVFQAGSMVAELVGNSSLAILRSLGPYEFAVGLLNTGHEEDIIDITKVFLLDPSTDLKVYTASKGSSLSKNETVPAGGIRLAGRGSGLLVRGFTLLS